MLHGRHELYQLDQIMKKININSYIYQYKWIFRSTIFYIFVDPSLVHISLNLLVK